ncbi:B12-binding domain-containing radical SAM protein [Thermodesulfobacteriota bacterium]
MARISLINPPYFLDERYGKLAPIGATLPHLGLLMLGAVLREAGYRAHILDASARNLNYAETLEEIKKIKPDLVGFTAVTPSILKAAKMASMIKAYDSSLPIMVGGPHVTAIPEETLKTYPVFDYGIVGEGDVTIVETVDALSAGRKPTSVPGVVFRENNRIRFAPQRPPVKNLDDLPFPAWDLLDGFPDQYTPALFKYIRLPSTHIISARGCPFKCIFCDTAVFSRQVRFHSPEYVLEMIRFLVEKYQMKEIIFEDDQFLLKKDRVWEVCEGLLNADLDITWSCSGRVSSVDDPVLLGLMKQSGCWQINYGIESASQKILDFARKAITVEQVEKAVRLTHEAGILAKGYFIFGLPHETEKTMEKTIQFAKRIPLTDISVFMLTPFPGSRVYDIASLYGTIDNDFSKMNILDVVYVPEGLSKETLIYYQKRFMRTFYLRPRIVMSYLKRLLANPGILFRMLKAFYGFMQSVFGKTDSI